MLFSVKKNKSEFITLAFFIIFFIAIRSIHFTEALNFSSDQGNGMAHVLEMLSNKEITLVGPGSSLSVNGKELLQGAINYYITIFFGLLGGFDPVVTSYIFMLFASLAIIPLYIGTKKLADKKIALLMVTIYTLFFYFIDYTRFLFGPNYLIALTTGLVFLMGNYKSKPSLKNLLLIFMYLGIMLQFHYQVFVIFGFVFFYYSFSSKTRIKSVLIMILGFIIGFSPMIVFELKNEFYNLRVAWDYIFLPKNTYGSFVDFVPHRYLSLVLLGLVAVLVYLRKYFSYSLILIIAGLLLIIDLFLYLPRPTHGFGMAPDWNYLMEKKTYEIIKSQPYQNFNIVNHVYDNLSMVVKYHLKKDGYKMNYDDYYHNDYLYVVSPDPDVFKDPAYELYTFKPNKLLKTWKLNDTYNLYLFERIKAT